MSTESVPEGSGKHDAPRPPTVADGPFCELVARDLGIKLSTARTAFIGEATQRVLGVVAWAMNESEDPERRAKAIVCWAKKRRCGAFREQSDEYVSLAGSIAKGEEAHYRENEALARILAKYWAENPRRLARVLDEVEIWVNVRQDDGTGAGV